MLDTIVLIAFPVLLLLGYGFYASRRSDVG